ncbi:MAG: hypothetical protein ABI590_01650 [Ilumatobacteraceae bacterium]
MEHQKQVAEQIDACVQLIEQMEQAPEANALMLMQAMDRLQQLLATPPAVCEIQTAFAKQEGVL